MADVKISALTAAVSVSVSDTIVLVQTNETKKATVDQLLANTSESLSILSHALSVVSQAGSVGDAGLSTRIDTVSNAASNALSIANAASNAASVVSNALSNEISNRLSHCNVISNAASNALSVANTVSAAVAGVSAVSAATSVKGLQSVVNQLSNRTSVLSQAISVVSTAASNALSVANAASQAASVADAHASVASVAATSVNARVTSLHAISVKSVGGTSVQGLANVLNALSNRISAAAGGSASPSSAAYLSTLSDVSHLRSIVSNVSCQSAGGSATGLQNVINMLSNKISQAGGGGGSVTSTELSAAVAVSCRAFSASGSSNTSVKGLQSVINQISNTFSNSHSAGSQLKSVLCQQLSVHSQLLSAGVGQSAQFRRRTGASVGLQTTTTLSIISGLSISVEAGGVYYVQGGLIYECATSGIIAFGVSVPPLATGGNYVVMRGKSATANENAAPSGMIALSAIAATATNVLSVSVNAVNSRMAMHMDAYLVASAAGSFGILGRRGGTTATASIFGGWIRAQRMA